MSIHTSSDEDPELTGDDHSALEKDDVFHLLQNARRRAVLRYFAAHDDETAFNMRDVAEAVAAWENGTTVKGLTSDQRQRVYIALYQSHLPKLDDYDVIEYNQSRGVIEPTPRTAVFDQYLDDEFHATGAGESTNQSGTDRSLFGEVRSLLNG